MFPADGDTFVASVSPPITANTSISTPNGTATSSAQPSRASVVAPSVRWICQRVANAIAASGIASRIIGWIRRLPASRKPGSTIGASSVPTACRNVSTSSEASKPASPISDASGVMSAIRNPATSTTPAAAEPAIAAAMIPGSASRSRSSPDNSAACGSTAPIRSWNVLGGGGGGGSAALGSGGGTARITASVGNVGAGRSSSSGSAGGGAGGGTARITASVGNVGAGRSSLSSGSRNSSWLAPQDGQKRARALMRSPQLGQKLVSFKKFPFASLALNGYHLRPMDARAWMVRLTLGVGLAGGFAAQALAQTPTPTPSVTAPTGSPTPTATLAPSGAPKILLAFDASGSMLTDDGKGTPKIDAAKEGAVALLSTLPDSTEVGLRLFGGTRPSRPIGPACQDSSLVLPLGRVDRGEAETAIRSFKARGRTPIAYALEQAAKDLGDSGSRTIVLVSDGKDTCQPPAPCDVAEEISKGGVELRIQAIGFRVDEEARQELECIAGGRRRRVPRRRPTRLRCGRSCACCPRARCASTSRAAPRPRAARAPARPRCSSRAATWTRSCRTPSTGSRSTSRAGRR